jgi:hypothetical protein
MANNAGRIVSGWLAAAAIAVACVAPASAGAFQRRPDPTTYQTIDCAESPHCIECGVPELDGIYCCFADVCTVVNKPEPPKPQESEVYEPEIEPLPVLPYRPLGLGSYHYFRQY